MAWQCQENVNAHISALCVCADVYITALHWIIRHQCIWAHSNCTFIYKSL